jgi:PAS domain-containing protein
MARRAGKTTQSTAEARLAAAVQRLQAEVDGLRRAQHSRAVIEQAKGLLAGRLSCSPEEAFDHLSRMSQQSNMKVTEVAAGVLGIATPAPDTANDRSPGSSFHPQRYASQTRTLEYGNADVPPVLPVLPEEVTARYHLACAAISAVDDVQALARVLWEEGLRHLGVTAVLVGVLEPDGAVRLVSAHGLPRSLTSAWQRVPSTLNVAFLQAVANGRTLWISRRQADTLGYQLLGEGNLRACVPLLSGGRILGVASIIWREEFQPDAVTRAYVGVLTEACGRRMSRLLHSVTGEAVGSPAAHWVDAVLEALPGSFALISPERDATGDIVDWRFDRCSPEATDASGRTADEICGRRLLDLYPHGSGVFEGYAHALRTGEPFTLPPTPLLLSSAQDQLPVLMSVRASRFGDGLLLHWQYHDSERQLAAHLDLLERLGDTGWAEWNMLSGESTWSPGVYEVLQRDPRQGPVKLQALLHYVVAEDAAMLRAALRTLTREKRPVDITVRLSRHGTCRHVHLIADPVVDRLGRLTAVRGAFRLLPDAGSTDNPG